MLAALAIGVTLTFYPVVKAFTLGQIQTWSTCLFTGALLSLRSGRRATAGALCGAMCLLKPQLGLLIVWALLRRQNRFAAAWAAVVLPAVALSIALYGWANHLDYLKLLSFLTQHSWAYYPNQSMNGLLNRWLFIGSNLVWDPHYVDYSPLVTVGTMVTSGALIVAALFWRPRDAGRSEVLDFCIAGLSLTLASPLAWEHHYGILAPILACMVPAAFGVTPRRGVQIATGVAFALSSNVFQIAGLLADTRMNVLQSYLFAGALLTLALLYRLRH
jgi:hypothetical protein